MTNESEDESAEEGEFVPSSWDHSLQPKRSSLKSPEKEKPEEVSCGKKFLIFFDYWILIIYSPRRNLVVLHLNSNDIIRCTSIHVKLRRFHQL